MDLREEKEGGVICNAIKWTFEKKKKEE